MNLFDLSGRVAVVTGGNGGLGLGMARGLVKAGAHVAIWARSEEKNANALLELHALDAGDAIALPCDVAEEAQIEEAMGRTLEAFGRVDACFANAGISGSGTAIPDMESQGWDRVMTVNARGPALTYKHVTRHMIERAKSGDPGGKLIATSSGQSIMGVNKSSDYAASKAALNGLTRGAAFELARYQITANALLFGFYETDITAAANPKFAEWMAKRIPLRRPGDHEGLEGLAVFFASSHSDYITGQSLPVDGGLCIS
ncbi:NAD(P)-dependent dehydrogenase, short-chain alcohol dehydrogenase family [Erythrobacter litoralis]|uniref:3-oxoacyl-ACP reductase n=1 Tax=Erythrobacter litoralis TaxID=39960 RepID=A0A074N051_9SPHN|nr:SDR family oxidoreductase [Erythrobacter litoralis]AOL23485.1 NAD(P)-dependent dehydrogenase, short-chain alcohol dehydrogenase family [Erythrobacter litoralis]KEO99029.1 3-oxoacyl-ACP reductase [Erythrobacter litoralis]